MKITIDEKVCLKHKMTVQEVLFALAIKSSDSPMGELLNMENRNILVKDRDVYRVTQHWSDVLDEILQDSLGSCERSEEDLINLAIQVKDCFPQTKMKDRFGRETPYYYRCNKSEVAKALKRFFTQYGNDFTDEEIIDATKRYVASFRGVYTGMRLAKYFIMKNPVKQGEDGTGYVEQVSDLLTFIENKGNESEADIPVGDEWTVNLKN